MAEEHISRGQIIRIVQKISLRHPRGLTKEWLYSILKPVVDGLAADLKAQEPQDNKPDLGTDKESPKPVEEKGKKKQGTKPKEKNK